MTKKYSLCILFLGLVFFSYIAKATFSSEEEHAPRAHSICLMEDPREYTSQEWLSKFIEYTQQQGRQIQRLESGEYRIHNVRFVSDIDKLSVGYGLLTKGDECLNPKLQLERTIYEHLTTLGMTIKIINGYINNFDMDEEKLTYTPNAINVFVPHISYVIQRTKNAIPELVPGGMLFTETGQRIVIISGEGTQEVNTKIEEFYNHVYRSEKDEPIVIYSGYKIANAYVPYILHEAACKLPIFRRTYLGKLSEMMESKFPYTKKNKIKNRISLTFQFLFLLFKSKFEAIYKNRPDTVRLLKDFGCNFVSQIQVDDDNKFIKKSFSKILKEHREDFLIAALNRLERQVKQLKYHAEISLVNTIVQYMRYALNPDPLQDIEVSRRFWEDIKNLDRNIVCDNPDSDSGGTITVARRLKKYVLENSKSHTEQLFIKLVMLDPTLLTHHFERVKEVGYQNSRCLGVIVDAFSWLDICLSCARYLGTNELWQQALTEVFPRAPESASLPIGSLFRVVSHSRYRNDLTDLSEAGGGSNYFASGWDYRVLSEHRYTLATRLAEKQKRLTQLTRDRVFERISSSLATAVLTKSIGFWKEQYPSISQFALKPTQRAFAGNAIAILFLRFPNEKAVRIKKIITDKKQSRFEEVYQLAAPLVREAVEFSESDKEFITNIISDPDNLAEFPRYVNVFFAEACLDLFEKDGTDNKWNYIRELAQFGFEKKDYDELGTATFNDIIEHIIRYWKEEWNEGNAYVRWHTPKEIDEKNTRNVMYALKKAINGEGYVPEIDEGTRDFFSTLEVRSDEYSS